ncbi:MAG TPA: MOSC domain-containing protein [Vicinamibacteria bacterium]|nr:MOSC domain-containing protein [Vicinamibacteria bacterium]
MARGVLVSINRSNGGVPKLPVTEADITEAGVEGDRQRDLHFHGGPNRAVSLFSLERIRALQDEGHPIDVGTTGENFTVTGVDWDQVLPGSRLRVGDVELEVTSYAHPCANIAGSFDDRSFIRMSQKKHPGWSRVYARVLHAARARVGDAIELLP